VTQTLRSRGQGSQLGERLGSHLRSIGRREEIAPDGDLARRLAQIYARILASAGNAELSVKASAAPSDLAGPGAAQGEGTDDQPA